MFNQFSKTIVCSIVLLQFSSCQLFQDKNQNLTQSPAAESKAALLAKTYEADDIKAFFKAKRKVASEGVRCDLESDRCNGKPLDQAQMAKTIFLTDQVANKLLEIENTEKLAGREFKVALIGRMGSNLKKFQPLKDKNKNGETLTVDELVAQLMSDSQNSFSDTTPTPGTIDQKVMMDYFDRSRQLKYSHLGIAVKNMTLKDKNGKIVTSPEKGYWSVVHLLYSCEDHKRSYVFKGTLASFFYDHMSDYKAQILVPEISMQNNVEDILVKDYIGKNWIEKQYNAIALSNDLNQQNSNQWVLEVLAAALYPSGQIKDRAQAQAILQKTNYHETKVTPTGLYSAIRVPFVSKMISSMMPTVCMQYQPNIQKYGIGEIISALSLEEYLITNKRLSSKFEVELTGEDIEAIDSHLAPKKNKKEVSNN